jgi:hypothetical protein
LIGATIEKEISRDANAMMSLGNLIGRIIDIPTE